MIAPPLAEHELMALTGAVIVWWSRIERLMHDDLRILSAWPDPAARAHAAAPPQVASTTLEHWRKAAALASPEQAAAISAIGVELRECLTERNFLTHAFWDYPRAEDREVIALSRVRGRDWSTQIFESRSIAQSDLARLHNRLARVYHSVLAIVLEHLRAHRLAAPEA